MFSAIAIKSGALDARSPGLRLRLVRRLNRQDRRYRMAHPDPVLMEKRPTYRRLREMEERRSER